GIDIEALGHVVNFDVPEAPDDYIHRVGRTARAGEIGDAFTFVAPDEHNDRPEGRLEIPIGERIAAIRARKSEERARSKSKTQRAASNGDSRGGSRGAARG